MELEKTQEDWSYILGTGHWEAYGRLGLDMDQIRAATDSWARQLEGVALPWLCWNVDPDWCLVQQRLVREVGWTPVVGFDPRVGAPPLIEGAVCIDFNEQFRLPTMWLHFPVEFIFMFCERMAFWHADLLVERTKMRSIADRFARLPDGSAAAVLPKERWINFTPGRRKRYWEVIGCNTRGSSRSQFENGCGWWMNFWMHPSNSAAERARRSDHYYDSGTGIRYWHKVCGGEMLLIPERLIEEGHCTRIGRQDYIEKSPNNYRRDLSRELSVNTQLLDVCTRLGIADLLDHA